MTPFTYFQLGHHRELPEEWLAWLGRAVSAQTQSLDAPPLGFDHWQPTLARHGLLPLLYTRLRDDPMWPTLSVEIGAALGDAFQRSATRSLLLQRELRRIGEAFPWLGLLKGAALGLTVYGDPAQRPVSDLDLLARPEDAAAATERLTALGYRGIGAAASPTLGGLARRFRSQLPLTGRIPGIPHLLVELHWSLVEVPYYVKLIPADEIWAGADARTAAPLAIPRHAVLLSHAAAHLAMHHSRDLRLIWLVDVDRLARSPALDWDDVVRLADQWKLGLALYAALADAAMWLGPAAPKPVMSALARLSHDPIAKQSWGIGDDRGRRAWRRAVASFSALPPETALQYAGWLAARAALRPVERWMISRQRRSR